MKKWIHIIFLLLFFLYTLSHLYNCKSSGVFNEIKNTELKITSPTQDLFNICDDFDSNTINSANFSWEDNKDQGIEYYELILNGEIMDKKEIPFTDPIEKDISFDNPGFYRWFIRGGNNFQYQYLSQATTGAICVRMPINFDNLRVTANCDNFTFDWDLNSNVTLNSPEEYVRQCINNTIRIEVIDNNQIIDIPNDDPDLGFVPKVLFSQLLDFSMPITGGNSYSYANGHFTFVLNDLTAFTPCNGGKYQFRLVDTQCADNNGIALTITDPIVFYDIRLIDPANSTFNPITLSEPTDGSSFTDPLTQPTFKWDLSACLEPVQRDFQLNIYDHNPGLIANLDLYKILQVEVTGNQYTPPDGTLDPNRCYWWTVRSVSPCATSIINPPNQLKPGAFNTIGPLAWTEITSQINGIQSETWRDNSKYTNGNMPPTLILDKKNNRIIGSCAEGFQYASADLYEDRIHEIVFKLTLNVNNTLYRYDLLSDGYDNPFQYNPSYDSERRINKLQMDINNNIYILVDRNLYKMNDGENNFNFFSDTGISLLPEGLINPTTFYDPNTNRLIIWGGNQVNDKFDFNDDVYLNDMYIFDLEGSGGWSVNNMRFWSIPFARANALSTLAIDFNSIYLTFGLRCVDWNSSSCYTTDIKRLDLSIDPSQEYDYSWNSVTVQNSSGSPMTLNPYDQANFIYVSPSYLIRFQGVQLVPFNLINSMNIYQINESDLDILTDITMNVTINPALVPDIQDPDLLTLGLGYATGGSVYDCREGKIYYIINPQNSTVRVFELSGLPRCCE